MYSVTFNSECTYIKEVPFFSCTQTEYREMLIQRDTHTQSECGKKACNFVKKRLNTGVFL